MKRKKRKMRWLIAIPILWIGIGSLGVAKTVPVEFHGKEAELTIDNKGTKYLAWTFNGQVPGPLVRVTEGDVVDFTLVNEITNKKSHAMDFHAAQLDAAKDFGQIRPGETKHYSFKANYPGVFFYHCGADPMVQHIARGMFGVIIVDPKDPKAMPKADREYVLVQSEIYSNPDDEKSLMEGKWEFAAFNFCKFKYDPVHDERATTWLQAKPGERVRIYFVNAGPNEFASFHPIAGIWDRVYVGGNPKNVLYGLQSFTVGPGDGAIFDLVSPVEGANAIVTHSMKQALSGAIAIIMFTKDADPKMGRGDQILVR
ncbi:multicopper oxidase domain-containing protein [Methylacidiphilum caldifontis]|nr:multicopper oxidase domain-containing protein [Methylacidiphilum caldifontis]QSR89081.1 multicopper oxidase domain-containing protein [Methylacidiphilum caldifontis]